MNRQLRELPQINNLIKFYNLKYNELATNYIKIVSKDVVEKYRKKILDGKTIDIDSIYNDIDYILLTAKNNQLKKVINGTGVVLHTNLGRAPLSINAIERIKEISSGYSNLEYDITNGIRGSRYDHVVDIVCSITGAEDALIVNNNAAAVFLILNSTCKDKEVIVSRGELVEIGGSFRIPDIMRSAGAQMIEVGTTNRTHFYDYKNAITENTKAIMKVNPSNYKVVGFSSGVELKDLKNIDKESLLFIEDLGSGSLIDLQELGLSYEKRVQDSIKEGVDLVSFSGDKLLGGPQCGIICGSKNLINTIKSNQLLRAFRVDKLVLAALESVLKSYIEGTYALDNPTIRMLNTTIDELYKKAEKLKSKLESIINADIKICSTNSIVGGGSYPDETLESVGICIKDNIGVDTLERHMRLSKYAIIGNIVKDKYILDMRTLEEKDFNKISEVLIEYYA